MKKLLSAVFAVAAIAIVPALLMGQAPSTTPKPAQGAGTLVLTGKIPTEAVAVMQAMKDSGVKGTITFKQDAGNMLVTGKISGLKPGKHGFHVHQFGDLRDPEGKSAGDHYNPAGEKHGGPHTDHRHAGDLGNVEAGQDGVANVDIKMPGVHFMQVIGRSIVVHADPDDLSSQPSGNAGARIGVGVIGISKEEDAGSAAPKAH